jgi:hypothetical protein
LERGRIVRTAENHFLASYHHHDIANIRLMASDGNTRPAYCSDVVRPWRIVARRSAGGGVDIIPMNAGRASASAAPIVRRGRSGVEFLARRSPIRLRAAQIFNGRLVRLLINPYAFGAAATGIGLADI